MKGLIILVNGFEDVEALATIDVLRRSGIIIDTTSLDNKDISYKYDYKVEIEAEVVDKESRNTVFKKKKQEN